MAGRWHSRGRRIVYAAESSALAMLELLVHLETDRVPPDFQLLRIAVPDGKEFARWPGSRPAGIEASRAWGDGWIDAAKLPLARVPSAIAPGSWNWLINPDCSDADGIRVESKSRWPWDQRLFRN